ncbi:MAG: PAS domain-containing protein, partial [Campylobacterota bacterium]|nr:PAS domain-containing protein [Campylobacterota bacterium]
MKNISIKKISTYGFLVLIFGSIISAFTLIFLLFKLENIKEDFSLVQDTHNSFLQVKTDTQKLLTTDNIEVANGVLKLSIDRFNTNLNTINLVNRNSILEINNLWYICQKELILIDKILSKPIFSPKNTKNKPLLHRRGELFFQDTSTKFYLLLTEVTNSIEYLLQNEVFILEIFEKINNEQKIYEEAELKNIKNYAIYLPLFILIITIILAISISRIATNIEKRLIVSNREQNQLLALFDGGDSALFKWNNDDNWSVAYVSKSVESFFGYSEKEFLDGSVVYASLIHKEDINQVTVEVGDALKNNTEYFELIPYRVVTKSGKIKWVIDHTVLVKDDNGDVINFIGFITDISELRQKEQMLFQQSKMAAMGEMIGNIAHQWRQPIAIIAMWANNIIADIDMD